MTASLLWDAGPGETRAGLVEHGQLTEFRIIRPRRRERALLAAGEIYTARITSGLGNGRALVTLGEGIDAVLQPVPKFSEGTLLAVEMTRAPVPEPGRWKLAQVKPARDVVAQAQIGWHFSAEPWELFPQRMASKVDEFVCPDAATANELRNLILQDRSVSVRIDKAMIDEADFDGLIELGVRGDFPLECGALSIERTRAMTMIDVDGSGDAAAINRAAAQEIPRLLRLFDIGGQIGIDFLASPDRKARLDLDSIMAEACGQLGAHERTAVNGFGFVQIVRPRTGPSIPEIVCETTVGRLSLDSKAVALLREAGRSKGHGPRRLVGPPAVVDRIKDWPEEIDALRNSLGVAIELVSDASIASYGHVHVSQS